MILELKNFTKIQRENLQNYYDSLYKNGTLLPPYEKFDEMGLKYPVEHLAEIGKIVIFFPVEIMVNYVDNATKKIIDETTENDFNNDKSLLSFFTNLIWKAKRNLDTTAIGNIAYCYLYSKSNLMRNAAKEQLDIIHSMMEKSVKKSISTKK